MNAGDVLRYAVAIALGAVAIVLVLQGLRNTLQALTLAQQTRLQKQVKTLAERVADLEKKRAAFATLRARVSLLEVELASTDKVVNEVAKNLLEKDRLTDVLIHDLQNVIEPDGSPPSGSVTNAPPPASSKEGMQDQ